MPDPHPLVRFHFDRNSAVPLHHQLYDRIRFAVTEGRLKPGERVASARSLAAQLGVARGTIDIAYARLCGDGILEGRGQRGTVVSPTIRAPAKAIKQAAVRNDKPDVVMPFQLGLPALDLVPRKVWSRLLVREARKSMGEQLAYPDAIGLSELRQAIAVYLSLSRGIACGPHQIAITNGYQGALDLAARLVLKPDDTVWYEDPGYGSGRAALSNLGMRVVPVPVDEEGLSVIHGRRFYPRARLAVVTPAHQCVLGMPLSPARRQALLRWAETADAFVLEDDYDCEFHYTGYKPTALKSLDAGDRVFYAGSFSKTLFPALRLGYLLVPARLAAQAARACRDLGRGHPVLEQAVAAAFLSEGHFARHLRRMRIAYKSRRQALASALMQQFDGDIQLTLPPGGLHIVARFPRHGSDRSLAARALGHGLKVAPLSEQYMRKVLGDGLILGFTNVLERDAERLSVALKKALG